MGYDDNRNQPTSMKVDRTNNAADKVVDYAYQYYDANGKNNNRIRQITDNIDTAYTTSYQYDDYNRLTNATASAFSRNYQFDPFGNIKNFAGITLNYATDSTGAPTTNRLTSDSVGLSYGYDAAGNMTGSGGQAYSYDGANRLKTASNGTSSYGYDGDGKRVRKTENGSAVYYVYSTMSGQAMMEVTAASIQRAYIYDGKKLVAMQATDGQFYWNHRNHLGNARAMTDVNGNLAYKGQFDPYGAALTEWSSTGNTNLNNKKFTGYERDSATGLDYAEARMYSSGRGRLLTPDPIGLKAVNQKRPESLNRYAYVGNDPVNFIDPAGTFAYNPLCQNLIWNGLTVGNTCGNSFGSFWDMFQILMPEPEPVPEPYEPEPMLPECTITLAARPLEGSLGQAGFYHMFVIVQGNDPSEKPIVYHAWNDDYYPTPDPNPNDTLLWATINDWDARDRDYQQSDGLKKGHSTSFTFPIPCLQARMSFDETSRLLNSKRVPYENAVAGPGPFNNSNAFAYTLLDRLDPGIKNVLSFEFFKGFDKTRVPGWGNRVTGL